MPKLINRPPKMSKKSDGQAYVTIQEKRIYLGRFGSEEALKAYNAVVAEYASVKTISAFRTSMVTTVDDLFLSYSDFLKKEEIKGSKIDNMKIVIRMVSPLYGDIAVDDFRSIALKTIQDILVKTTIKRSGETLSRRYVNDIVSFIVQIFKWGVSMEMVQEETWRVLSTIESLKKGKARETAPRENVPTETVLKTLPFLSSVVADMVRYQMATACRPGEIFVLRKCDCRKMGYAVVYFPESHKNKWRGQGRNIILTPEALEIVERRSENKEPEDYIFAPMDAYLEKWAADAAARKSPMTPSQRKRHEKAVAQKRLSVRSTYSKDSYNRAITRAIERANAAGVLMPHWTPYQLRHEALTQIRAKYGIEVAQAVAGHRSIDTTQIYLHNQIEIASRILGDQEKVPKST